MGDIDVHLGQSEVYSRGEEGRAKCYTDCISIRPVVVFVSISTTH